MKKRKIRKILIGIAIGLLVVGIGFIIAIPVLVMNSFVNKHVDFHEVYTPGEFGVDAEPFFVTTSDGLRISAWEVETEHPKAVVVCLSGIHNPSATIYFGHARYFREHGYATILFDMRAHGNSDGDMICLGYREHLDTRAIVDHIKADPDYQGVPVVVFGLSMGGATAINSIGEIEEIDGLISLSAFSSWEDVFYEQMSMQAPAVLTAMIRPVVRLVSWAKFGVNPWQMRPVNAIEKLGRRPALLMHTRGDSQVGFANLQRLRERAPAHVETFVRDADQHFVTYNFADPEQDPEYAYTILNFLQRHFPGGDGL
ncbi:MAG: alpha/beta hydrolase [Bacteroidales bacterium]